jgi:hypothetical protein
MASAGVVGYSEVIVPNSSSTGGGLNGTPAMWSMIWVGVAILILMFIHLALMGRAAR